MVSMAKVSLKCSLVTIALNVIHAENAKSELKVFNSIVPAKRELMQLPPHELMTNALNTAELKVMFPNLSMLATIGVLPMSTVDCKKGFSALSCIKTNIRNRLSSKILNDPMIITVEGPSPDKFPHDQACDI